MKNISMLTEFSLQFARNLLGFTDILFSLASDMEKSYGLSHLEFFHHLKNLPK